jgi:hypothetical protein
MSVSKAVSIVAASEGREQKGMGYLLRAGGWPVGSFLAGGDLGEVGRGGR